LEIYNETITDLLNPTATNLQLREDPVRGIYVDGLSEKEVLNGQSYICILASELRFNTSFCSQVRSRRTGVLVSARKKFKCSFKTKTRLLGDNFSMMQSMMNHV
jgi:hypothetical protein